MQNGRLTLVRIVAASIVTLSCLAASVYLATLGHPIPVEFSIIEIAGMAGVVGVDVVASILAKKG